MRVLVVVSVRKDLFQNHVRVTGMVQESGHITHARRVYGKRAATISRVVATQSLRFIDVDNVRRVPLFVRILLLLLRSLCRREALPHIRPDVLPPRQVALRHDPDTLPLHILHMEFNVKLTVAHKLVVKNGRNEGTKEEW